MKYDYLIVGSGLYGAVCACELTKKGYKCLIIEKRNHIGGNVYTKNIEGINVHQYGAHIFHTHDKKIWEYVNSFVEFNSYVNSPIAIYKEELYNLPFNMNTFSKLFNIKTPKEALAKIEEEKKRFNIVNPKNLEEQAISLVGETIYNKLIKGYTAKQWGKPCVELPSFIIKRLPIRFTYDNNYFNDRYQGIPIGGYTKLIEKLIGKVEVQLDTDFFSERSKFQLLANKIIYTGPIDQYFDYSLGKLEYRTVYFENEVIDEENFQGNAVVNYTDAEIPYTRIIEHKHFDPENSNSKTVISKEYSKTWIPGDEPYYPMNDEANTDLYNKYNELALKESNVIFGGRLAQYRYYDMDDVIIEALNFVKEVKENE